MHRNWSTWLYGASCLLLAAPAIAQPQDSLEQGLGQLVNQARIRAGLQPLETDEQLADVARQHSHDMVVNQFSPTSRRPPVT